MLPPSDHSQFVALVDGHGASVMGLLRRLCRNTHDAEDVFQETAVRVWRSFSSRPRLRNPRGWLMTIAYRTFLDHRARRTRPECLVEPADKCGGNPLEAAEQSEMRDQLNAAIANLAEPIREVVLLHYSGGLSLRQTAKAMGISTGTVKSRLNTALRALRSVLE